MQALQLRATQHNHFMNAVEKDMNEGPDACRHPEIIEFFISRGLKEHASRLSHEVMTGTSLDAIDAIADHLGMSEIAKMQLRLCMPEINESLQKTADKTNSSGGNFESPEKRASGAVEECEWGPLKRQKNQSPELELCM